MKRDVVIGVVGGVILLAALIAVLAVESGSAPETELTYPVTWMTSEAGTTRQQQRLNEGEEASITLPLQAVNVTVVEVLLQWTDDRGNADTFNLTVSGPDGEPIATESSSEGEILLRFEVNEVPEVQTIRATSASQAAQRLASAQTSGDGRGTWTALVELISAPGQRPVPGVPELEVEPDGSNDFTIQFTYDVYRAQVGEPIPPA